MTDEDPLTTRSAHPAPVEAGLRAAGFDNAHIIGQGGFGVVYRCRETALGRTVAVKVLTSPPDAGQENRQRFQREQRAMGNLPEHPNIVRILRIGVVEGFPFLVMPFYPQGSLEERIRRSGPLTAEAALSMVTRLSGALETIHRAGILHRDVKPGNILLTDYGEPQLTDFGIARIEGSFRTSTGVVVGSPAFTAPEVLRGGAPSVKSDVYGLGATLFCLITGHAAYQRRSDEALVAQFLRITEGPAPDLRNEGIPDDFCGLIEMSMAADPDARPASAEEFGTLAQQLQRAHGLTVDKVVVPAMIERQREPEERQSDQPTTQARATDTAKGLTPLVAETKFRPELAARPLVKRPRLLEVMNADPRPRLIVIHAPAGFGKSTLAAQWARQATNRGAAGCWLNIDDDDNNLAWFLLHLFEAIRRSRPALVDGMTELVEENGAAQRAMCSPN
ncbi:protein kinase [Nocardia nova]|uniref:serine/threonine-protein kinase n=1 Tax=Nocardia nova TaxID=37330 RepID=UPI0037B88F69